MNKDMVLVIFIDILWGWDAYICLSKGLAT